MKYCLGILIFIGIFGGSLAAQQANWLWARSGGGKGYDQVISLAADKSGNIFATGYYRDSAVFSGTTIRSAKSGTHFFFAKYSSDGSLLWIQTSPVKGQSQGTGVCIGEDKYLYLTGYFSDSIIFGSHLLLSQGTHNIFLAKYDLDGSLLWAISDGANADDLPQ